MEQFYEDLKCLGMDKSEVIYTDEKKVSARRNGWCPPEAQRPKAASQGCTVRQEILLSSTCLTVGTAEVTKAMGVDASPGQTSLGITEDTWNSREDREG